MATATPKPLAESTRHTPLEIVSDSMAMGVMFALILTVVQRGIGFLRGILFCRLMTDEQLGQWSMVWSFLMLLAPLAVLGLPGCFGRYVEYYRSRGQLRTFVTRVGVISGIMTLLLSGTLVLAPSQYSWLIFRETGEIAIVQCLALALVFVSLLNWLSSLLEALRQVRMVTLMRFINGVVFTIAATSLMLIWSDATSAATIGFGIGCVFACIPALWFLWKYRAGIVSDGGRLGQLPMWRRIAPFAIWLWCSNLFNNLFEVSDRYMLVHWSPVTPEAAQSFVGQYHSGRVIPLLMVGVATMLGGVLMPYMSAAWEAGRKSVARDQLNWTIKVMALVFTAGGIFVLAAAPLLFNWILEGRYNDGLAVLPLTLVYCIWFSLFTVGQDYLWVAEKGKLAFIAVAIGLAVNIALNVWWIPIYGLWGAVWATTLANAVNVVLIYLFNHVIGCATNIGCWITAAVPLLLILPLSAAIAVWMLVIGLALKSSLIFDAQEKRNLAQAGQIAREKIASYFGGGLA